LPEGEIRVLILYCLRTHDEVKPVPQVDAKLEVERLRVGVAHPKPPGGHGQVRLHLHSCEELADAVSGSRRKRKHGQFVPSTGFPGFKSIWIKEIRLLPEAGMPLDKIGR